MSMQSLPLSPAWDNDIVVTKVNAAGVTTALTNEGESDLRVVRNLFQGAVPVILPAAGTVATNGAISFTATNLPTGFTGGAWCYLPAAAASQTVAGATVAFASAVAGFYWVVFSSNTAGVVKQNFILAANMGIPAAPAVVDITATGSNVAYTPTTTILQMASYSIPGNLIGANGQVRATTLVSESGDVNSKVVTANFGSAAKTWTNATAATLEAELTDIITNRGATNVQVRRGSSAYLQTTAVAYASQDTTASVVYKLSGTTANVASNIVLESFSLDILPSA